MALRLSFVQLAKGIVELSAARLRAPDPPKQPSCPGDLWFGQRSIWSVAVSM
jgi:hypothetical protein